MLLESTVLGYTFDEMRKELEIFRGKPLSVSTHRYRINKLSLLPEESGYYSVKSLDTLKKLDRFLSKSGTSIGLFIQVMNNASS